MSKRKPFIFVTQDKLMDLCRYDIGWIDTVGGSDSDAYPFSGFDVQCEAEYPMLLSDLKTALTHFDEDNISYEDFLFDWWYPITTYFYEDLCLDELFGPDPDMIADYPFPPLINSDEDMLVTVLVKIAKNADDIGEGTIPSGSASKILAIPHLIELIENYEDNKDLPFEERNYTLDEMLAFINHWDNSLLLVDAPEYVISLFVRFTNELCEQNYFEAIKLKAFACNGGNRAFPCDYKEAVRLLEILLKNFGFGYAANALGFIYYDGKLTGKPDYEKAFSYFAIASNYNVSEAKLKFADMLLAGNIGQPDPLTAYSMYLQVYNDARIRFESGEYNAVLPESAYRIAMAFKSFPAQKVKRLKLLLEATYSAFVRYQTGKLHSDLEFSKEVQKEIDEVINEFKKGTDKVKINSAWQDLGNEDVTDVFNDFAAPPFPAYYTLKLKKQKSGNIKFSIKRHSIFTETPAPLSLTVQPWLLRTGLSDQLDFSIPGITGNAILDLLVKKSGDTYFDKLVVTNDGNGLSSTFSFFRTGRLVLSFTSERVFFNKPSGKMLS